MCRPNRVRPVPFKPFFTSLVALVAMTFVGASPAAALEVEKAESKPAVVDRNVRESDRAAFEGRRRQSASWRTSLAGRLRSPARKVRSQGAGPGTPGTPGASRSRQVDVHQRVDDTLFFRVSLGVDYRPVNLIGDSRGFYTVGFGIVRPFN